MSTVLMILVIAFVFIVTFYFVYNAGFQDGCNTSFRAYIQEWVEIKQRVSDETWKEIQRAYVVMDDRKRKIANRVKK